MRILVVKLSSIGDVVHALPALEVLRAALPRATIGWAVEAEAAPLLEGHPALDRVHVLDRRGLERARGRTGALRRTASALRALRAERYDAALDLQGLARSALVSRLAAPRVFGPARARELATLAYTDPLDVPAPAAAHAVERSVLAVRGMLRELDVSVPEGPPPVARLRLAVAERVRAATALAAAGTNAGPFVALLPGAGKLANRLPVRLLAGVADALAAQGVSVVLVGGPGDRRRARRIAELARGGPVADLVGTLELRVSAAVLERASVVVGGDTGPLHVARALGRPVVPVFFAADPRRTGPAGLPGTAPVRLLRGAAPCAPCCARRCQRADRVRICLEPLSGIAISEAVLGLLTKNGASTGTGPARLEVLRS